MIVEFIDAHRDEHGVEPICQALQIAPSTYYAAKTRTPSARSITDAATTAVIERVHAEETFYRHNTAATNVAASVPSLH